MKKHLSRESIKYKIGIISIMILLSALNIYLYTIGELKEVEIDSIYYFLYLIMVFFAIVIRRIIIDLIVLSFLLIPIIYYFI